MEQSRAIIDAGPHALARRARRLRASLRRQPARLHRLLQNLQSQRADSEPQTPHARDRAAEFAALVAGQVQRGILRYSARRMLLGRARRLGIERFEANLIIAAVQHRAGPANSPPLGPPRRSSLAKPLLAAAVLQGLILLGAWWTLIR